jgi:nitronate monooxygenase
LATQESNVSDDYRNGIIESSAADVVYTNLFTGVHGNYLKKSIVAAGLDPDNLPQADKTKMNFGSSGGAKAWRDIWGAGQGVGLMDDAPTTAELISRLQDEYAKARSRLLGQ